MTRRNRIVLGIASLGLAAGLGYTIRAAATGIPATNALSYAGVLEDATGPITGSHNVQVILYDAATAGNNLCQSLPAALTIQDGHFSVQLPDACTTAVGANPNVWADVLVDGSDTGRTKIGAVPYAVEANHTPNADKATNATNATNCSSCTNATNATSCSSCTNATNATNANNTSSIAGAYTDVVVPTSFSGDASNCWTAIINTTAGAGYLCSRACTAFCKGNGHIGGWFNGQANPSPALFGCECVN